MVFFLQFLSPLALHASFYLVNLSEIKHTMKSYTLIISIFFYLFSFTANAQIDFASAISHTLGSDVESVTTGDVNNDGLIDAVVATTFYFDADYDYSIFVFLQQPDGSVAQPVRYQYAESYGSWVAVQVADVNNDNLNDVIFTFSNSIGIMYQNQEGSLNAVQTMYSGQTTDGLKTGDLNNDGLTDIAVCHWNDNFIRVFYQVTGGGFQEITYPIESHGWDEIDVNDMNGDGLNDVIYMPGQGGGSTVYIFYQDSNTGLLGLPVGYDYQISYYYHFNGIGTGDLNNDGRADLVGSIGGNSAWIAICYQQPDGTMGPATYLPSYDIPTPVEIADLNCDNKNEIIVGHRAWSKFSVWEQDANSIFSGYKLYGSLYYTGPYGLAVGDINNDSRKDVLAVSGSSNVYFMYNTSAPEETAALDTIVNYTINITDTIDSWTNTYQTEDTKKVNECLLKTRYKLKETSYYILRNIEGDSLFPRNFFICGMQQTDTLIHHFDEYNSSNDIHTDTTILWVDTLIENKIYINTWTQNDTTSIQPIVQKNVFVKYDYSIIGNTIYLSTDSLSVTTLLLNIDFIQTYYSVYEGFKCGNFLTDTVQESYFMNNKILLDSDTVLISHTVTTYPYGISEKENIAGIKLYPNPASDKCLLEFSNELNDKGTFEIKIYNTAGQQVWETQTPASENISIVIEGQHFAPGLYVVSIRGDKSYGSVRLAITR